jgi:predicted metal-dependent HD superfamily phosphohydrolase
LIHEVFFKLTVADPQGEVPQVQQLHASWLRAWQGVGGRGDGEALFSSLVARYSEPHRKYHSVQHLSECLAAFEPVRHLPPHPAEVEAALWFHDAIYEVQRSDNEKLSAAWAEREFLQAGAPREAAELVASLVLATKHDALPTTLDEQVLVDIDLSILGAPEARFAQYEQQIRQEYAFVPGFLFRRKRRAILQTFLDRPSIYSTPHFNAALEQAARKNLLRAVGARAT